VDIVETDEHPFIDYLSSGAKLIKGSSGVTGRLKHCFSYWESTISAPCFVLDVISDGYKLPFIRVPAPCFIRTNSSAKLHPNFVEETISKLLVTNCIVEHIELLTA